jgi:uncharacterized cupin superfamily protein
MSEQPTAHVLNVADVEETAYDGNRYYNTRHKQLTPRGARLGVGLNRVAPGHTACPFHSHQLEHEVFFVTAGRGVLRYGEELRVLVPGDCVYCPAGTGIAHQLANPFDEDFVYFAIGTNDPNEVCVYPDNGKVMVRALKTVGTLEKLPYLSGEPATPKIFELFSGMDGVDSSD